MKSKLASFASFAVAAAIVALGYFNVPPAGPWIRHYFYRAKAAAQPPAVGVNSKDPAAAASCRANLEMVERAKAGIRQRGNARATGTVSWKEVMAFHNLHQPQLLCPAGGAYDLGTMSQAAKCSIGGNQSTDPKDDHLIKSY
jgi:hypothetical protein